MASFIQFHLIVLSNDVRFNNNQLLYIFISSSVDTRHAPNVVLMLGHRVRRCPSINTALDQYRRFATFNYQLSR